MKRVKDLSLTSTVIIIISICFYLIGAFILFFDLKDLFFEIVGKSAQSMGGIDKNSPSAGYEALFAGFGQLFGLLGGIFSFIAGVLFFLVCLYQVPMVLSGLKVCREYKKNEDYMTEGFVKACMLDVKIKLIMCGIVIFGAFMLCGSIINGLFVTVNFAIVFILTLIQAIKINSLLR